MELFNQRVLLARLLERAMSNIAAVVHAFEMNLGQRLIGPREGLFKRVSRRSYSQYPATSGDQLVAHAEVPEWKTCTPGTWAAAVKPLIGNPVR